MNSVDNNNGRKKKLERVVFGLFISSISKEKCSTLKKYFESKMRNHTNVFFRNEIFNSKATYSL
tara:strand:+ start:472 stop:663 length:192 start_codon:yes stop_codon:yes gene_type:complete